MKIKRCIFVLSLIALFCVCFYQMNQHYDKLARYPHELSEEQRTQVLTLSTEDINYLVAQKIEPQQFLPYIEMEGFELANTLWYDTAMVTRKDETQYIVSFINKYKSHMEYGQLEDILKNYSYNVLTRFFDEGDATIANAELVANPSDMYAIINGKQTVFTYEPSDLVNINSLPHKNIVEGMNDITIKKEVLKPLQELGEAAYEINRKTFGDMSIVAGYISYEDQVALFEKAKKEFENEDVLEYWDYPGQSEYQLGYTIQLKPNETSASKKDDKDTKEPNEEEKQQAVWLRENAYKYGFVVRYPKEKEKITGKKYQPYTLRYVGREMALKMQDQKQVMEDAKFEK